MYSFVYSQDILSLIIHGWPLFMKISLKQFDHNDVDAGCWMLNDDDDLEFYIFFM